MVKGKHILIIGGMGPQASLYAHKRLVEECQKMVANANNSAYPRITHLSINVEDFISNPDKKDEALNYIMQCLHDINPDSVDVGFIACNTAHLLFDDIQKAVNGKLISMIDAVRANIVTNQAVGILATPLTLNAKLYNLRNIIKPEEGDLADVECIIRSVIANGPDQKLADRLNHEVSKLRSYGAEKIILGCSELSILGSLLSAEDIIDPISITIRNILGVK